MVKQIFKIDTLKETLILIRIDQWIKNFLIFSPLLFSGVKISESFVDLSVVLIVFIMVSSLVYILNDILDKKKDRLIPFKKKRPIASNKISTKFSLNLFFILLFLISIISYHFINLKVTLLLISYLLINLVYSYFLKKIFIIDILTVSTGYVIRVLAGYSQLNLQHETILLSGVFLLSLAILMIKRKTEFNIAVHTKSLRFYNNKNIFNSIYYSINFLILINYYFFSKNILNTGNLILSFMPVIIVLLRLNYLLMKQQIKKNITNVLTADYIMLISFIIWVVIIISNPIKNYLL